MFDRTNRKFTALKVRTKPGYDVIGAKQLMEKTRKIKKLLRDTGYDSEGIYMNTAIIERFKQLSSQEKT